MDLAEQWLAANDPDYENQSKAWEHITLTGDYRRPRDEYPWGDLADLTKTVEEGKGKFIEYADIGERLCWVCEQPFKPREQAHRYCGDLCRVKARREYQRELMRQRRAAA